MTAAGPDLAPGFEDWARARQASLRRTGYLLCGDWHAAQDLVQETLTRVYRAWDRIGDTGSVEGYARKVMTNAFIDGRRLRRSGETPVETLPEPSAPGSRAGTAGPDVALRLTLLDALAAMPPSQRAVLVLRYWEDLSTTQTAALLGCSEGNVKSQAARGLTALRSRLVAAGVDLVEGADEPDDGPAPGRVVGAVVRRLPRTRRPSRPRPDDDLGERLARTLRAVLLPCPTAVAS